MTDRHDWLWQWRKRTLTRTVESFPPHSRWRWIPSQDELAMFFSTAYLFDRAELFAGIFTVVIHALFGDIEMQGIGVQFFLVLRHFLNHHAKGTENTDDDEIHWRERRDSREIFHRRPFASFGIFHTLLYGEIFDLFRDAPEEQTLQRKWRADRLPTAWRQRCADGEVRSKDRRFHRAILFVSAQDCSSDRHRSFEPRIYERDSWRRTRMAHSLENIVFNLQEVVCHRLKGEFVKKRGNSIETTIQQKENGFRFICSLRRNQPLEQELPSCRSITSPMVASSALYWFSFCCTAWANSSIFSLSLEWEK